MNSTADSSSVSVHRVAFVTGTRADFGKVAPLATAAAKVGFETSFFVTGMHMMQRYGDTRIEVRRQASGNIYEFVNQSPGDPHDVVLSKTMQGFIDWVTEHPVDLVVVHGDRVEALAVALVCAMRYIRCAHIEGGELSGTIDEVYRHCNTKLCGYHFVSSASAARRVLALGESPDDVFIIGSPELDVHDAPAQVTLSEVKARYGIEFEDFGIALFHPVTSELDSLRSQAESLFRELVASRRKFVVICPNNDPGSEQIFEVIDALPTEQFRVIPSMRFAYFSVLMRHSAVIVGNSSLGVREAPFLGVPSLNVGTRQNQRSQSRSITHAHASESDVIASFLSNKWGFRFDRSGEFGAGDAAARFVEIILDPAFWDRPRQKAFFESP